MNLQTMPPKLMLYTIVFSTLWLTGQATTEVKARTSQTPTSEMMTLVSEKAVSANQVNQSETTGSAYQIDERSFQVFLPVVMNSDCTYTIGLNESKADGRDELSAVSPGDTVCIEGGIRNHLKLKNFQGTPERPIIFKNIGGQVVIDSDSTHGIIIQNSQYFRLTGTGGGDTYGIKIIASEGSGVRIGWKSEYFEVDHIEVTGVRGSAIAAQTKGVCPDGSNNDYDYDNDGKYKYDKDDVVNRDNFTQRSSIFHHNYTHNIGTEGFYIGSSAYNPENEVNCDDGKKTIYDPLLHDVQIYENLIEETDWDGLQVGSATEACTIHHNRIYRDSQAEEKGQESGIMNNPGSVCDIYNNLIKDSGSRGIYIQGNGGNKIYNNIIVNPGQNTPDSGIYISKTTLNSNLMVVNNTIINPPKHGIIYRNESGYNNFIENNLTINPGAGISEAIKLASENGVVVSNNFATMDITEVGFVDPASDNYALQDNSPAVDVGKPQAITIDFTNAPRPQGKGFDIGATER